MPLADSDTPAAKGEARNERSRSCTCFPCIQRISFPPTLSLRTEPREVWQSWAQGDVAMIVVHGGSLTAEGDGPTRGCCVEVKPLRTRVILPIGRLALSGGIQTSFLLHTSPEGGTELAMMEG